MDNEKKYNELVGKIKRAYLYAQTNSTKAVLEDILPELAESKDEKIRKAIYGWINTRPSLFFDDGFSKEEMLAWLEKQGEQKLTNSYCQEHCKGFQETGKCFADGDCKAKTTYKDEPKEDNRPVTERIKTFDDAREALGDEHPLVKEYWGVVNVDLDITQDLIAYLKLRIIVAALNEGWEPKFEKGEYRFYPWFYLYTKEQYDELDDERKERCVLRSGNNTHSHSGFVYVYAGSDASGSSAGYGSRLVFRTRELAVYAGRQFTEEWADFVFKTE